MKSAGVTRRSFCCVPPPGYSTLSCLICERVCIQVNYIWNARSQFERKSDKHNQAACSCDANETPRHYTEIIVCRMVTVCPKLKVVAKGHDAKSIKVETVMTRQVVTCWAEDDLQKALDAMAEHQLRRIPIVDNDNRIVRIISQADVATRVNQPEKTATMVKEISQSN